MPLPIATDTFAAREAADDTFTSLLVGLGAAPCSSAGSASPTPWFSRFWNAAARSACAGRSVPPGGRSAPSSSPNPCSCRTRRSRRSRRSRRRRRSPPRRHRHHRPRAHPTLARRRPRLGVSGRRRGDPPDRCPGRPSPRSPSRPTRPGRSPPGTVTTSACVARRRLPTMTSTAVLVALTSRQAWVDQVRVP